MMEKMTCEKAKELTGKGFHCSQVALYHVAEKLGMDPNLALKVSSGLGGGCFKGGTCGAVTGSIMALSLKYGFDMTTSVEEIAKKNPVLMVKAQEFQDKFAEKCGSTVCAELLGGLNIGIPEEYAKIVSEGKIQNCPQYIADACDILDEMLAEDLK